MKHTEALTTEQAGASFQVPFPGQGGDEVSEGEDVGEDVREGVGESVEDNVRGIGEGGGERRLVMLSVSTAERGTIKLLPVSESREGVLGRSHPLVFNTPFTHERL